MKLSLGTALTALAGVMLGRAWMRAETVRATSSTVTLPEVVPLLHAAPTPTTYEASPATKLNAILQSP